MGESPQNLFVDPVNNQIFVSSCTPTAPQTYSDSDGRTQCYHAVIVIDGYTNDIIENITMPSYLLGNISMPIYNMKVLAFDPNTDKLYMIGKNEPVEEATSTLFVHDPHPYLGYGNPARTLLTGINISTMDINPISGILYVAVDNENKPGTVLALDEYSVLVDKGAILSNVTVGISPSSMAINPLTNKVYVANSGSNSVTIIDGKTNKGIKNVTVGDSPSGIVIDPRTNIVYVANRNSGTISMINGSTNNVMTGITLKVRPLNFGSISCNGRKISDNYILYDLGTRSVAQLVTNNTSGQIPFIGSLIDYISKGSIDFKQWSNSNDTDANHTVTFTASKYETLTANFKQNPPLPDWLWTAMISIIISAVIALYKIVSRNTHRINTTEYEKRIESTYNALHQNREECLHRLNERRRQIVELFAKGKISRKNYELLDNTISNYESEMFKL